MTFTNTEAPGPGHKTHWKPRKDGFQGLLERGMFTIVQEAAAKCHRIDGSRLVNSIENRRKPSAFQNSRLFVQAYNNFDHGYVTYARTVQRVSQ